jgi:cell division protein FtsN
MSRDYKPSAKTSGRKVGNPMFAGILIGLFAGLGIALAVAFYIFTHMPGLFVAKDKTAATAEQRAAPSGEAAKDAAAEKAPTQEAATPEKPRFDFYKILPGTEEPVSDQELKQAAQQAANGVKDSFYLQVGSFQTEAEADNLKAKLALLGVEAVIQTATLPEKGVWHRVRVGPYSDIQDVNHIRATLAQNSIESTLIKVKEPAR